MEDALAVVLEHSIIQLRPLVHEKSRDPNRQSFFSIIHNLPITCKPLLELAKSYESFEYILFYERTRLRVASKDYFFDAVPAGVVLTEGSEIDMLQTAPLRITGIKLRDTYNRKFETVDKLEHHPSFRLWSPGITAGLSDEVPWSVCVLVEDTRYMFERLRLSKRQETFRHCANCNCKRLFYIGESAETWNSVNTEQTIDDDEEDYSSQNYWNSVGGKVVNSEPDSRRFCSSTCKHEHALHLARMMPDSDLNLDVDDNAMKLGRPRVQEAFKLALKRNEVAARALRTMRSKTFPNLAVHPAEIEIHRQVKITALNVDIALLYAASLLAESHNLSKGKLLPGQCTYWRDQHMIYSKAINTVKKIYAKHQRKEGIISSMLTKSKFMDSISFVVAKLF